MLPADMLWSPVFFHVMAAIYLMNIVVLLTSVSQTLEPWNSLTFGLLM